MTRLDAASTPSRRPLTQTRPDRQPPPSFTPARPTSLLTVGVAYPIRYAAQPAAGYPRGSTVRG